MKATFALLFASLTLPALSFSQEPAPRRRPVLPQTKPLQAPQVPPVPRQPQPETAASIPAENITLSLSGALGEGLPIDVSLTGCGREFRCEITMGSVTIGEDEIPVIGSLSFTVTVQDGDRIVQYSVGYRIPTPTATNRGPQVINTSISYQEMVVTGEARCVLDKDVQIFKNGETALTLKITKP